MKALRIVGIILLVLIVLFFVIALFLPAKLHIEESMVMKKPANLIFKQVNNFKNWEAWSPWLESDPAMEISYSGQDLGIGASCSWKSDLHGNGTMTIIDSKPYELISCELKSPEGDVFYRNIYFQETDEGTKVTWKEDIPELAYPIERYFGLLMPGMMKKFFVGGLERLDEITGKMKDPITVHIATIPETKVITVLDSCYWQDFETKMAGAYGELMTFLGRRRNVQMAGAPYTMYFKWDEEKQFAVFEAGIPVDREIRSSRRVSYKVIPETKAIMSTHYGSYELLGEAYMALEEYIMEFGLEEECCPMEVYITDPETEPDTSQWQTDIYFPIK
jgi:effector-binding domain-containing protein